MTTLAPVTIFGGTGFLGRKIAARLLDQGLPVRTVSRHPPARDDRASAHGDRLEPVQADIHDSAAVETAIRGSKAVVNAVSLYVEGDGATFRSVHVTGAARLAGLARKHGAERLLHISGIGAHPHASSRYGRCRGEGEEAVRREFPGATILRPSVMFGPDDAFLNTLVQLLRRLPVFPLLGSGKTRLQPVFVNDVAQAAANVLTGRQPADRIYELGGPKVCTYRSLVELIMKATGYRRLLLPLPFSGWQAIAAAASLLPSPPVTFSQVQLMRQDNVASSDFPGLRDLDVQPTGVETVLWDHFA